MSTFVNGLPCDPPVLEFTPVTADNIHDYAMRSSADAEVVDSKVITDEEISEMDQSDGKIQDKPRIRVLPGGEETGLSYQIDDEDHTLGNALRWMIMKNPDVELCGYTIPHPSEPKMNIRVQTYENTTAQAALDKGLDDLMELCDAVIDEVTQARAAHGKD